MFKFLVKNDRNLIQSLDSVPFSDTGERLRVYKLWDLKANKAVISRNVIFSENFMLKSTQGEEQQVPKSSSSNKQVVQAELETPMQENNSQDIETSTSEVEE
jgi:hypothetical protein